MVPVETPQATYGNLEIVHVPKLTHQNLKSYLSTATGLRTYQQWMIGIILDNTKPGQKVLVVCKKDMIKHEYIPNWPRGDERFRNPKAFTTEYGWQLDRAPYHLETNVPGVFVAGDVRAESAKRVASAVGEGAMAVMFVHRYLETLS